MFTGDAEPSQSLDPCSFPSKDLPYPPVDTCLEAAAKLAIVIALAVTCSPLPLSWLAIAHLVGS